MVAAGKGSIINIASMSSILPLSRVVAYSASKAAVLNLTQWLAREWATKGVRVNAISPGFFPAEQNRRMLLKDDGTYTERGQAIIGHTPMGRFGEAERTGRRGGLAGVAEGVGVRDRSEHRRGRRVLVGDDLSRFGSRGRIRFLQTHTPPCNDPVILATTRATTLQRVGASRYASAFSITSPPLSVSRSSRPLWR